MISIWRSASAISGAHRSIAASPAAGSSVITSASGRIMPISSPVGEPYRYHDSDDSYRHGNAYPVGPFVIHGSDLGSDEPALCDRDHGRCIGKAAMRPTLCTVVLKQLPRPAVFRDIGIDANMQPAASPADRNFPTPAVFLIARRAVAEGGCS
jgi:hypothetical protein